MKPEDLKNSNDELKATSEDSGAADTPKLNQDTNTEAEKTDAGKPVGGMPQEVKPVSENEDSAENKNEESSAKGEENEVPKDTNDSSKEEPEDAVAESESTLEEVVESKDEDKTEKVDAEERGTKEEKTEETVAESDSALDEAVESKNDDRTENTGDKNEASDKEGSTRESSGPAPEENVSEDSVDYTALNEVELINALRDLLENHAEEDIKADVDSIKINFYKKHRAIADEEKKKFLEEGGKEEDFEPSNAWYEDDLRNLLKDYRQVRNKQHRELEDEKEENLQRKYEIIEEIKNLVNRKESINKTFQEFRDLQQEWREIGLVPQSKLKDLWETYHHHVENFYDYIKINRELRDLDLKKNMEAKIKLCEKAEELLVEPSVIKAFNILQKYHEQWREIGPVPRDKKEELWERFKAATSKINKKHQAYFENRKQEQKKNLEAKTVLCEKAEEIANLEISSHKDWDKKSRELIELQKVWRTIGFAPKKDNNRIYERFRSACDKFFDAKREFYAQNKELQLNNLQMKTDLCVQAEALKDSTDWRKTTDEFIRIQKKWKEIGPVPRKHSDAIWKRFRAACDFFFDNKSRHFHHVDEEQVDNLKLKRDLIEEVKNFKLTMDEENDLQQIKEFQRRWTDIGHVPYKDKDVIQNEFRDAINKHFDSLKIDEQKRSLLKFKTKMSNISGTTRGSNKMRYERDKYINKLKQLENDLILLNNNVGFFANTKNAESLIDDVNKKIQDTQEKIEFLKEKINIIDSMDDED